MIAGPVQIFECIKNFSKLVKLGARFEKRPMHPVRSQPGHELPLTKMMVTTVKIARIFDCCDVFIVFSVLASP